jgi:uncharacterized protein (DUF1810 family)
MKQEEGLQRFLNAQERAYGTALAEIQAGRKRSHWMWYIFPQIRGLGFSDTSKFYAIHDLNEATQYLQHPLLGSRLKEISKALLRIPENNANRIFGSPDDLKLRSCMTLFAALPDTEPVFQQVLDKFFGGTPDSKTLQQFK